MVAVSIPAKFLSNVELKHADEMGWSGVGDVGWSDIHSSHAHYAKELHGCCHWVGWAMTLATLCTDSITFILHKSTCS